MKPARAGLLALGLAACACETTTIFHGNPDDAPAQESDYVRAAAPLTGVEFDALWDRAGQVVGMEGYSVDSGRSSYSDREMVSHWNTLLAPTRFEGKRSRVRIRFSEAAPNGWAVEVAVQAQRNVDIDQPSAASQAQWEDIAPNTSRAGLVLWKIESGFRSPGEDPQPK